jgi:YesN/AraC family two-component response regulator
VFSGNFDYLNRIFHTISGQTIFKYLNHIRIINAKRLIETSELKTAEIGYLVGFNDPYYFSKQFKKYTGITPTEYLKEKRKSK